jgi:hypothetical protein
MTGLNPETKLQHHSKDYVANYVQENAVPLSRRTVIIWQRKLFTKSSPSNGWLYSCLLSGRYLAHILTILTYFTTVLASYEMYDTNIISIAASPFTFI